MTTAPQPPPVRFYRVEWDEGFGWPECERRERTSRNFTTLAAAARQVAIIRALPSHHRLVSFWIGHTEWTRLTDDEREAMIEEVTSGWDVDTPGDGDTAA